MPCLLQFNVWKWAENLEHVHGLSTSSDSKATGEGKERRQTAFRINEAERIYVAVSQDSDMSILCHHALPGATSAGFPLTLPAQACVRFILRRYMPIFGWFGTENCSHRMHPEERPCESVHPKGKLSPDGFSIPH